MGRRSTAIRRKVRCCWLAREVKKNIWRLELDIGEKEHYLFRPSLLVEGERGVKRVLHGLGIVFVHREKK